MPKSAARGRKAPLAPPAVQNITPSFDEVTDVLNHIHRSSQRIFGQTIAPLAQGDGVALLLTHRGSLARRYGTATADEVIRRMDLLKQALVNRGLRAEVIVLDEPGTLPGVQSIPDVGGNAEVIVEGQTGFLVPSRSPNELGAALARVASSPQTMASFGDAGRRRADDLFSVDSMVKHTERLYLDLVAAGTLDVLFTGGYTPGGTTSYQLLNVTGGLSGAFSQINLPTLDANWSWDTSALLTSGQLNLNFTPVPEPSTYALLAGGLGLVAWVRRRRNGSGS